MEISENGGIWTTVEDRCALWTKRREKKKRKKKVVLLLSRWRENHTRLALIPWFNGCEFGMTSVIRPQVRGFAQGGKPGVHAPRFITTCSPVTELVGPGNQTSETSCLCLFFRLGLFWGLYSAEIPRHLYHNIYNRIRLKEGTTTI